MADTVITHAPSLEGQERIAIALENIAVAQAAVAGGTAGAGFLDAQFTAMLDGTNTTKIFKLWYPLTEPSGEGGETKYERLERWFNMLANAWSDKVYTLRWYQASVSTSAEMTPLDDLAKDFDKPAALATDIDDGGDDWAEENPMTWYVRANALSLADGTMDILAIEGVDNNFDKHGDIAPVYTFSLALWLRDYEDESYNYKSWCTTQRGGFSPYAGDVAPDNTKRVMTWHPSVGGGLNADGKLTSGIDTYPYVFASAATGLTKACLWDAYEGLWNDCDSKWVLDMWKLRHWNLENSGILEGCTNYNYQKLVAVAESDTTRVILSVADGVNYEVGSCVMVGDATTNTNLDREQAYMRNIVSIVEILSKEDVTISGITYTALNLDVDATFATTTTCYVSTAPWKNGTTEAVPGHKDGCIRNLTSGRFPIRIAGVELLNGAYSVGIEPLYNVTTNPDGGFDYEIYECRDSEKLGSTISANHIDTGLGYKGMTTGWHYVAEFIRTKLGVLFPSTLGGGSTTRYKSGFYGTGSPGVRVPWRFGYLSAGAAGGVACEVGFNAPSYSHWYGSPRLGGSGKKRGEWAA